MNQWPLYASGSYYGKDKRHISAQNRESNEVSIESSPMLAGILCALHNWRHWEKESWIERHPLPRPESEAPVESMTSLEAW